VSGASPQRIGWASVTPALLWTLVFFVVPFVADQDNRVVVFGEFDRFQMHFGHQRTSRIDRQKVALLGQFADFGRYTVRREKNGGFWGNLFEMVHENRTFGLERSNHILVVNDFVENVDRGAKMLECKVEAFDRHVDSRTKSTGSRK
jgi:hypothetical protein